MPALIGALRVSLSADTASFHSGMKRAEAQARSSGTAINKSLGLIRAGFVGLASGLSIGLIMRGIKAGLDYAGSLREVAQQLGVTTRQLQVYRYAASQVGVSQEKLEAGLSKLNVSLGQAKLGAKAPAAAFAELSKIIGKDIVAASQQGGDALPLVADGLAKITDRSKRAAIEVALFSRAGAQLDPLLSGGSAALNELAAAADKLGIVLDDHLIDQADEAADKLDALQTVLSAQIAGTVAKNSDAILVLANALIAVAGAAGKAISQLAALANFMASNPLAALSPAAGLGAFIGGQITAPSKKGSATAVIPKARPVVAPGADVGKFLASGGGGGRKGRKDNSAEEAERKRLQALRDAFQFEEEQRRADMDILRAKQQLATDYSDRATLSVQMLDLEKSAFEAELQYRIAAKELSVPQADILRAKFAINDALQRQIVLEDEQADRLRDFNRLADLDFDLKRDQLQSEAQLAETASERRDVELRLLDLIYRQERARLEAVLADEKSSWAAKEEARRRLALLDKTQANDIAGVEAGTRGPMEDWLASLPTTAAKAQEALERLQVDAFEGLIDAAVLLTEGFDGAKDALLGTLKSFLQGLLKMQLQSALSSVISSSGFKLPGFALGGFTGNMPRNQIAGFVHGNEGVLNSRGLATLGVPTLNALNRGVPLAAVSNDNGTRAVIQNWNIVTPDADSFRRNQRQLGREARRGLAIQ